MLIALCGPSASGKSTLAEATGLPKLITCTTRPPRKGEVDGVHYRFLSERKFDALARQGAFAETAVYAGRRYGALLADVGAVMRSGRPYVAVLERTGVRSLKTFYGDLVHSVYVGGAHQELKERLEARLAMNVGRDDIEERLRLLE